MFIAYFILSFVFWYLTNVAFLNLTFYPQIYQWISIFGKKNVIHVVFTILSILADFGYSFTMFFFAFSMIFGFVNVFEDTAITTLGYIWKDEDYLKTDVIGRFFRDTIFYAIMVILALVVREAMFYIIVIFISITFLLFSLSSSISKLSSYFSNGHVDCGNTNFVKKRACGNLFISNLFNRKYESIEHCSNLGFHIVCGIIVLTGQLYIWIVAGMSFEESNTTERAGIIVGIIARIFLFPRIIDYNIFDFIFNTKRTCKIICPEDEDKDKDKNKDEQKNDGEEENEIQLDALDRSELNQQMIEKSESQPDILEQNKEEKELSKFSKWLIAWYDEIKENEGAPLPVRSKTDMLSAFISSVALYIVGIIVVVVIFIYTATKDMAEVNYIIYNDNNTEWHRYSDNFSTGLPEFCNVELNYDTGMRSDDILMLTTLPRLYKYTSDGKCIIQPALRGVFNTTMKYIFGRDYDTKNITIMCYPKTNDPYLVITSDVFKSNVLSEYEGQEVTKIEPTIKAESHDYFKEHGICDDGIAENQCNRLKACMEKDPSNKCEDEWEYYTNAYWKEFADSTSNEDIIGLEQYQITINDSTVIQPLLVTKDGFKISGTHFIVGGGFENKQGYGYLIENTARIYLPYLLENFIPLYGWATSYFSSAYNKFSQYSYYFFYVESIADHELDNFNELIKIFNFTHKALFMVGQSISGTTIKEYSYITDIKGMSAEASIGKAIATISIDDKADLDEKQCNKILNIYSDGMLLSGIDDSFAKNGMLPNHFYNPNVYDTACQYAVSCSKTFKYFPFCNQVLTQGGKDPVKMFNSILDDYYATEVLDD